MKIKIIICTECYKVIPRKLKACSYCGAPKPRSKLTLKQWTIMILGIIILYTFGYIVNTNDFSSMDFSTMDNYNKKNSLSSGSTSGAYVFCKDFVKLRLKSPNTAIFEPITSTVITNLNGGNYHVTGSVRAQNSFGGFGLENYSCNVTANPDGGYLLNSLNMTLIN